MEFKLTPSITIVGVELKNSHALKMKLKRQILSLVCELQELEKNRYGSTVKLPQVRSKTDKFIGQIAECIRWPWITAEVEKESEVGALTQLVHYLELARLRSEIKQKVHSLVKMLLHRQLRFYRYVAAVKSLESTGTPLLTSFPEMANLLISNEESFDSHLLASAIAEEELRRASDSDPSFPCMGYFADVVISFDFRGSFDAIFDEMIGRLITESIARAPQSVDPEFGENALEYRKSILASIDRHISEGKSSVRTRLNVRRGGRRPKKGWTWTKERKVKLYLKSESLKDERGQCLWKNAHDELIESDFDSRVKSRHRNQTELKSASDSLWKDALAAWRNCSNTFTNLPSDKSPRTFRLRHAIELLGFNESAPSTLQRYETEGKRISSQNK